MSGERVVHAVYHKQVVEAKDKEIAELREEVRKLKIDLEVMESCARSGSEPSLFCEHPSQYSWSPDGAGKKIICLLCAYEKNHDNHKVVPEENMSQSIKANRDISVGYGDGKIPGAPKFQGRMLHLKLSNGNDVYVGKDENHPHGGTGYLHELYADQPEGERTRLAFSLTEEACEALVVLYALHGVCELAAEGLDFSKHKPGMKNYTSQYRPNTKETDRTTEGA